MSRKIDRQHPYPQPSFFHYGWLGLLALACGIASIQPLEMQGYLLHQVGTAVGVMLLYLLTWQGKVSKLGFAGTIGFILIHVLGAHYLYSYVPYNDWFKACFSFDLNGYFGWTRNMYDRLVHIGYGLLLYPLLCDVFSTWFPEAKRGRVALLAIQFVMASSLFYELIEWWISLEMSPQDAENYNGQQGDNWDAHKDMALATLGALIAWLLERLVHMFKKS